MPPAVERQVMLNAVCVYVCVCFCVCVFVFVCVQVMLNAVKCTIATLFFLGVVPFRIHVWRAGLQLMHPTGLGAPPVPLQYPAPLHPNATSSNSTDLGEPLRPHPVAPASLYPNATSSSIAPLRSNATSMLEVEDGSESLEEEVPRFGMLVLSAFLGIAIGDIVWLQALQSLGARKLILVDSVKVTQ